MMSVLRDLLFPWPLLCAHCGERTDGDGLLCGNCGAKLDERAAIRGFAERGGIVKSAAAHYYIGPANAVVRAFKYDGIISLADKMVNDMLSAMQDAGIRAPDAVAFVPMRWSRRRTRHYNQAEVLAMRIAEAIGAPLCRDMRRVRAGRQQAKIASPEARARSMRGAFAAGVSVAGKKILLADDVYTTGATSGECARALIKAGASAVDLVVFAYAGHMRH